MGGIPQALPHRACIHTPCPHSLSPPHTILMTCLAPANVFSVFLLPASPDPPGQMMFFSILFPNLLLFCFFIRIIFLKGVGSSLWRLVTTEVRPGLQTPCHPPPGLPLHPSLCLLSLCPHFASPTKPLQMPVFHSCPSWHLWTHGVRLEAMFSTPSALAWAPSQLSPPTRLEVRTTSSGHPLWPWSTW